MKSGRLAKRFVFGTGGHSFGVVYGSIVVMAVIAAGSNGDRTEPWRLAVFVAATVLVLWVAHVYAHALSESVDLGRRLEWVEFRGLALREASVPLAGVAPIGALLLGAVDVIPEGVAIRLALGIGVTTLAAQGLRYARIERLGRAGTVVAVMANLMLGLVIVALEVGLSH
jgi:hypothetical protein